MKKFVNLARSRLAATSQKARQAFDLADCKIRLAKLEKQVAKSNRCTCKTKSRFARAGRIETRTIPTDAFGNQGLLKLAEVREGAFIPYGFVVYAENEENLEALVLLDKEGKFDGKYPAEVWVAEDSEDETFDRVWHGKGASGVGAARVLVETALKSLAEKARK